MDSFDTLEEINAANIANCGGFDVLDMQERVWLEVDEEDKDGWDSYLRVKI